jgi:hypothetical protein
MQNYFGKEIDIQSIADALTSLAQIPDDTNVKYYVWNDKADNQTDSIERESLSAKLLQKQLHGVSTEFPTILSKMCKYAPKDTLAILLTDGIISSSARKTNISGNFTDIDKGNIVADIQKSVKGSGKAISLYRFIGNYKGIYYNKANNGIKYDGQRPFYILVLGDPENVRYFDQRAREGKIHDIYTRASALHFATAPTNMKMQIELSQDAGADYASGDDFTRVESTFNYTYTGRQALRIVATLPKWVTENYGIDVIKHQSKVLINGKELQTEINLEDNVISFDLSEKVVNERNEEGLKYTIEYQLVDPVVGAWSHYSTNDDTQPDNSTTYLLQDFVEAIHKGLCGDSNLLLKSSLTITPQDTQNE